MLRSAQNEQSAASAATANARWGVSDELAGGRRRMGMQMLVGSCVFMIPWIIYLAVSLPVTFHARAWSAAWVGFDILLMGAITATGYAGWRRRHSVVPLSLVTATLLVCDAWFDVTLDWGDGWSMWESIATAVFLELPLAVFFASRARRIMRLTVRLAWLHAGIESEPPPLRKMPLYIVAAMDGVIDAVIDTDPRTGD